MTQILKSLVRRIAPVKYRSLLIGWFYKYKYYLLFFLYTGTEFECPFCGGHFRILLPGGLDLPVLKDNMVVGGGYRPNAICPRCSSWDRDRLIYLYLNNNGDICHPNVKLLHIAPEKLLQNYLKTYPNIDYLSADLNSPRAMVKMDITNIKYGDNQFDIIICNHVLEHVPDDRQAMSELYRVLKPGGWAILQVPISLSLKDTLEGSNVITPEEREKTLGQSDHLRLYARDYKDRLESAGFSTEVYSFVKEFGEAAARKYGLSKDENIYIGRKT